MSKENLLTLQNEVVLAKEKYATFTQYIEIQKNIMNKKIELAKLSLQYEIEMNHDKKTDV